MLRYCGVIAHAMCARGSPAWIAAHTFSSNAPWAANPSRSKSRRMMSMFTSAADPLIPTTCMKPWRPAVVSGVSVASGSAAMVFAARCVALTSLSLAQPGWMETPLMLTVAASAEKVSYTISPRCAPSSV
jgi:hypothetical protein